MRGARLVREASEARPDECVLVMPACIVRRGTFPKRWLRAPARSVAFRDNKGRHVEVPACVYVGPNYRSLALAGARQLARMARLAEESFE